MQLECGLALAPTVWAVKGRKSCSEQRRAPCVPLFPQILLLNSKVQTVVLRQPDIADGLLHSLRPLTGIPSNARIRRTVCERRSR